ncbi:amino acid adenylation domain-containing protein/non-ribosomal peptide synthase protein (TIGR01720 family) [Rheinheimera pacifica]|uniref:non-ribosomal peptide synthetase n=1 Tax=Rheinheimera pacifica TaxID=173990 RepID=UPI00216A65A7|nr:non-ribosomal peptide synthetase [Rheinheimera pacifica]MCS4307003.1 amino acid adenylation domain-containing protein/non-ribosomal peptide synthase protein (TIGR01720 family) [Rheinheimera pacifica]
MDIEEKLNALSPEQRALLMQRLAQRQSATPAAALLLPKADSAEHYPLSHEQQRIWFMSQFDPASPEYNIPMVYAVHGVLDTARLTEAVIQTLSFHPILRSQYREIDGTARQNILSLADFISNKRHTILPVVDFTERGEEQARSDALREIKEDCHTPFDLQHDGVFRSRLFLLSKQQYLWYINVHHIAFDAWSHSLLIQQIFQCYYQLGDKQPVSAITEYSYIDYACWQRSPAQEKQLLNKLAYWKDKLADVPPLELYTDRPRPSERTYNGNSVAVNIAPAISSKLRQLCHSTGATPFTLMLAVLRILLHKYSRQDDFAIGTLIANRSRTELENVIGFFTNTLAFRTDVDPQLSFLQQLEQEKTTVFNAFANQDISFEKLVEELNPPRDMSRAAIFQVMLILNNTQTPAAAEQHATAPVNRALQLQPLTTENQTAKYDLTFYFNDTGELSGFIEYNTDLFNRDTISRMAEHLTLLLQHLLAQPQQKLASVSLLSEQEKQQILQHWSRGDTLPASSCTLDQMVQRQAAATPELAAIVSRDTSLTYRQLDLLSTTLAQQLQASGVGRGSYVAIATERNAAMIVAMLGTLKAGAAYIPVDLSYPQDRVQYMFDTANIAAVISQPALSTNLPAGNWPVLQLSSDGNTLQQSSLPVTALTAQAQPADQAYVIFTSGSTGLPKGVMISHQTVVNFLQAMSRAPGVKQGETLLAVTTISFDIAVLEIFLPLINGGTVVLADKEQLQDANCILQLMQQHNISVMQATPSMWRMLLDMGWQGKRDMRILCGGEALPPELAETLLLRSSSFWNLYGPTEATVWCSRHRIESGDGENGAVTIGKPIENTRMYLLDDQMQPVPVGVPGEIYIGGNCLAEGYMARADLTAEAFVTDPLSGTGMLYRTRDLARYNSAGNIIFLGRADSQVKVRGFRIELGEIDTTLNKHPQVQQAVSVVHELKPGDKRIVCYFEASESALEHDKLRLYLKKHIPEYMVPAIFIQLDKLPLTPNGKINRRGLPKPSADLIQSGVPYVAPANDIEAALCQLYQQILRTERVGSDDDFFSLGGDSLLVIQLVSKAKLCNISLTARQVFQHKTPRLLAQASLTTQILRQLTPVEGPVSMTPAQRHFLSLQHTNPHFHTLGVYLEPRDNDFDLSAVERALQHVLTRHDSLRMRLPDADSARPSLLCDGPPASFTLRQVKLKADDQADYERQLGRRIYHSVTSLDLQQGPLFQACLYRCDLELKPTLFLFGHFMLADIGSWHIIIDDFETCYRQFSRNEPLQLPEKGTSFKQWVEKLSAWGHSDEMKKQRPYWLLPERKYAAELTKDFPDGQNLMSSSQSVYVQLDQQQTTVLLDEVPKITGAKIDAILLTSIVYAFRQSCKSNSLMIDLLGHGKEALFDDVDLSRTVGWFNTIYPAFLDYGNNTNPVAAIKAINEQLRAIPNGGIGYGVLRYLNQDQELIEHFSHTPEPQVFFNYFGHDNQADLRVLRKVDGFGGYGLDHQTKRLRPLAVGVYIKEGAMAIRWEFSNAIYQVDRIERLAADCQQCILEILNNYNKL